MLNLLELINSLNQSDNHPEKVIQLFSQRMRELYGSCATALICTEGLQPRECRIVAMYDQHGEAVIENMSLSVEEDSGPFYQEQFITEILNPHEPVIYRGESHGIHPIFVDRFHDYIDAITLPLFEPNNVFRWLVLLFTSANKVDDVDIERTLLVSTLASNYAMSVMNARKLQKANDWIQHELEAIGRMQELLLPQHLDNTPGVKVASYFSPHAFVGGDYYDVVNLSNIFDLKTPENDLDSWGVMIADASGHGAAAAVEIAMFDAILRTYKANIDAGPGGVLTYANDHFFTRMSRGNFITTFVSSYVPQKQTITYSNAGHPPPIHKSATGKISYLDQAHGIPLGILHDFKWDSGNHDMLPGDLVVFFTDGIIEATSPSGEMFGQDRLEKLLLDNPSDPDTLIKIIQKEIEQHQAGQPQRDDLTLILLLAL